MAKLEFICTQFDIIVIKFWPGGPLKKIARKMASGRLLFSALPVPPLFSEDEDQRRLAKGELWSSRSLNGMVVT